MTDLLPCPFCGSDCPIVVGLMTATVKCRSCGTNGPLCYTEVAASNAWNLRPIVTTRTLDDAPFTGNPADLEASGG